MVQDNSRVIERVLYMPKLTAPIHEKIDNPIEAWTIGNGNPPDWVLDFMEKNDLQYHQAGLLQGFHEGLDFVLKDAKIHPTGNYVVKFPNDKIMICPKEDFEYLFEPINFFYNIVSDCENYKPKK